MTAVVAVPVLVLGQVRHSARGNPRQEGRAATPRRRPEVVDVTVVTLHERTHLEIFIPWGEPGTRHRVPGRRSHTAREDPPVLPVVVGPGDGRVVRRPFAVTAPLPDGHVVHVLGSAERHGRGRNDSRFMPSLVDAVDHLLGKAVGPHR